MAAVVARAGVRRVTADKIEAGYDELERRGAAGAAAIWLDAWSDVVRLCDLTGIDSIRAFDGRFSMYQSLVNWSQDLEDALWNAGRGGSAGLTGTSSPLTGRKTTAGPVSCSVAATRLPASGIKQTLPTG